MPASNRPLCSQVSGGSIHRKTCFTVRRIFAVPSPLTPPSPPIYPRPHLLPIWAHQPPKALVIQLKRFVFDKAAAKIKDHILFGAKLKLGVSGPERSTTYDLTG